MLFAGPAFVKHDVRQPFQADSNVLPSAKAGCRPARSAG